MKKEVRKVFIIIAIVLFLLIVFSNFIFATDQIVNNLNAYNTNGENVNIPLIGKIIGIIRLVGTILSVVVLMIIGIKYMFGSVEEKADYKKTLIPYIIGAVLLFAGTNLVQIVYDLTKGVGNNTSYATQNVYQQVRQDTAARESVQNQIRQDMGIPTSGNSQRTSVTGTIFDTNPETSTNPALN